MDRSNVKILLVEDDEISRKAVVCFFQYLGCDISAVATASSTLDRVVIERYDVILLDINLPDMNGLLLAKWIRNMECLNKNTPIIALTAYSDQEHQAKALQSNLNNYVIKPITMESCKAILSSL